MGGMLVEILISCCALGGSIQSELTPACPAAFEQELGCTMNVAAAKIYFQGLRTMCIQTSSKQAAPACVEPVRSEVQSWAVLAGLFGQSL